MLAGRPAGRSLTISYQLHGSFALLGTVALWLGRHQAKPTASHRTLPQGHSRLLPAELANLDMERAAYWAQDREGGRTLNKNPRHGAVKQTPGSISDESVGMEGSE